MGVRMNSRSAPTKWTLALLAQRGWTADICERKEGPISRDLFGCIDVIAVHPHERRVIFVQCTSLANIASRIRKTIARSETVDMLLAGCHVEVWGWSDGTPLPRIEQLVLDRGVVVTRSHLQNYPEAPRAK